MTMQTKFSWCRRIAGWAFILLLPRLAAAVSLSPHSLTFAQQAIWTTSTAQQITVTNNSATTLNFLSIVASGDYGQTNNCGTSLAPQMTCVITVTFTPSGSGPRQGYVTLIDSAPTPLQTAGLTGRGAVPVSKLAISPGVASITVGQTTQYQATYNGTVTSTVTWSVDGIAGGNSTVGTISTAGLYVAPAASDSHVISAVTHQTPQSTASAKLFVSNNPGVLTWNVDQAHTGQNLNEIALNTGNVNSTQFGKLFSFKVDGQVYAQPLYVQGVNIPGQGTHNVLFVATENDSVYAFDADGQTTTPLWHVNFLNPPNVSIITSAQVNCNNIGSQVGITGTPVIDLSLGVLYVVVPTNESGQYVQRLHALNIASGTEEFGGPVTITASVPGTGAGSQGTGTVSFNPLRNEQRQGLVLLSDVVYLTWASYCDNNPYHGWTIGYDETTLQQTSVWNSDPNGTRSGLWQSGASPATDAQGNLYVMTGNGTFDASSGGVDYGDSFVQLSTGSGLSVSDYFTPFDQATDAAQDLDVGSGGPLVIPDQSGPYPHLLVGGGKIGTIYLIDRDAMGGYNPSNNNQIVQSLVGAVGGIYSTPAFWQNSIYFAGQGDYVKQFLLYDGRLSTTPIEKSTNQVGYPGATPAISADGTANGIVWVLNTMANFRSGGPVVLYAYDAVNVSRQLYNSSQNPGDQAGPTVKFNPPTVVNGKVYVGTNGEVDVYGLVP